MQLAWSQYKQGKWQAKQAAPQTLVFSGDWDSTDITLKSSFNGQMLQIDVFLDEVVTNYSSGGFGLFEITFGMTSIYNSPRTHVGRFLLGGAGSGVELFVGSNYVSQLANVGAGTRVDAVGVLSGGMIMPAIATPTATGFDGGWLSGSTMNFDNAARPRSAR